MNIPQGYKQTELGIIPEDWEIVIIKDIADITTGNKNTQDAENDGKYPFYVRSQNVERINSYSFDCEGVITAGDGVGTGKIFHFASGKFGLHQRAYLIYNFKDFSSRYFYWYFSQNFYDRINQMTAKSSVDSVRKEMIEGMQILVPPLPEQKAIAEALSDVDELITALDKKIAKKRLVKQGAMQELLTGKKRLPGFTDEWVEVALGEILSYEQPTKYLVSSTEYCQSGIPVLTAGKTFILGYTTETTGIYTDIPVIIFDDFTTDSKYVTTPFKAKSSAMKMLQLKDKRYNLRLIYDLMQLIQFPLYDHQRYWISEFSKINVNIPSSFKEQHAIATILSDMDKEIADLEAQRDKYRLVKYGMMQKLLTGEIRLRKE